MENIIESRLMSNQNKPVSLICSKAVVITPSDDDFFSGCNLYVGTGGDLTVVFIDSLATPITLKNVPSGAFLPIMVVKVLSTGTDADDILGLY